jgi:hypothetical protein
MRKMLWGIVPLLLSVILLSHCTTSPKETITTDHAAALLNKIDSEFVKSSDMQVAALKTAGATENKAISDAIRQYEASGMDINKKASIYWDLIADDDDNERAEAQAAAAEARWETRHGGIISRFAVTIPDRNFDLAIQHNDLAVQQAKIMNNQFGDVSADMMNAIAYYEKLSKEDKMKMMGSNVSLKPAPDYQNLIARQLERGYLLQRLQWERNLNRYIRNRLNRYINEFPQGFKPSTSFHDAGLDNDKQFDLKNVAAITRNR